jgi:hypothetical protein
MEKVTLDAQNLLRVYTEGENTVGQGLSLYLNNLNRGRQATPHSWLYEFDKDTDVLARWIEIMQAANNKNKFGEEFCRFDLKQVEKFGPQGEIPPISSKECWEVVEPMYSSSTFDDPDALKEWFPKAHEFGRKLFGDQALRNRPLAPEAVVKDMARRDTLTTNSGFPRFTKRSKTYPEEIRDARNPNALPLQYPAVILFRHYYGKLRPVWMFPMSTNLIEAGYALKIQSCVTQSPLQWVRDYCTPWLGFEHVKSVLTQQWPDKAVISGGDTTKMDAHMRRAQIRLVYEIVKWLFQEQYWDGLHLSLMNVNEIDLLWSFDKNKYTVIRGTHGLASGSSWTQLTETVLQLFMAYIAGTHGQGIGDDFYWLPGMQADELVDHLERFGLPANPSKQSVEKDSLTFLQRYFHQDFLSRESGTTLGAYYPTIRALGSMLWPEKFHSPKVWNSDMFCIRNYMILENCVDDPCFDEFVRFVVLGHKDMIPFAKKSAKTLNAVQRQARSVPGLFPNYNQEKLSKPLSSFASINVAKEL